MKQIWVTSFSGGSFQRSSFGEKEMKAEFRPGQSLGRAFNFLLLLVCCANSFACMPFWLNFFTFLSSDTPERGPSHSGQECFTSRENRRLENLAQSRVQGLPVAQEWAPRALSGFPPPLLQNCSPLSLLICFAAFRVVKTWDCFSVMKVTHTSAL